MALSSCNRYSQIISGTPEKYLNPLQHIESNFTDVAITRYLGLLSEQVKTEAREHQKYLDNRDKFQIPSHAYGFEPTIIGLEVNDIWDSITIITNLAVENSDYPVFRKSIDTILKLVILSYSYDSKDDNHRIDSGMKEIARKRVRSIISHISDKDKSWIFFQSLSNELCRFLMEDEAIKQPCSEMTMAVASDVVWIGQKMLETDSIVEPIKILNTLHGVIEIGIHRLESSSDKNSNEQMDSYNITAYAYYIKSLGVTALTSENSHFAYRCMESLSYLGCNAAKLKSEQTVVAVLESIVHLGRFARNLNIGCFWSRCLIPVESHAEEFIGHILTWLAQDLDSTGKFFMKGHVEQSYSRLRGVKCTINPTAQRNPIFWIEVLKKNDNTIPHIEREVGMYGYGGQCDYSDFSNLKEYVLHGIGAESNTTICHSEPIPLEIDKIKRPES